MSGMDMSEVTAFEIMGAACTVRIRCLFVDSENDRLSLIWELMKIFIS